MTRVVAEVQQQDAVALRVGEIQHTRRAPFEGHTDDARVGGTDGDRAGRSQPIDAVLHMHLHDGAIAGHDGKHREATAVG